MRERKGQEPNTRQSRLPRAELVIQPKANSCQVCADSACEGRATRNGEECASGACTLPVLIVAPAHKEQHYETRTSSRVPTMQKTNGIDSTAVILSQRDLSECACTKCRSNTLTYCSYQLLVQCIASNCSMMFDTRGKPAVQQFKRQQARSRTMLPVDVSAHVA